MGNINKIYIFELWKSLYIGFFSPGICPVMILIWQLTYIHALRRYIKAEMFLWPFYSLCLVLFLFSEKFCLYTWVLRSNVHFRFFRNPYLYHCNPISLVSVLELQKENRDTSIRVWVFFPEVTLKAKISNPLTLIFKFLVLNFGYQGNHNLVMTH
jgi:hypothetical protein